MNKFFAAVNLVFVLAIVLLVTLSVRTWTHPPYPSRVEGSSLAGSSKNLQKLVVNKSGYSAGMVSQVVQNNLFRKERREYVPPPSPVLSAPPAAAAELALPPPNLVLKGVLMLADTKIAILQGKYSTREEGKVIQKEVKKKGYSLGQIVGDFELMEIEKNSVTLYDQRGQEIRLRLNTRPPDKVIHREGTAFFQKNKKYDPSKFKATPVKTRPKAKPASGQAPAPKFRISGAASPRPRVHISGK